MPVSFMGGIPGQFFREFGLTVAVAVFFSLLVARLMTPLLAAYFLKPHADAPRTPTARSCSGICSLLRWCVDAPAWIAG